MTQCVNDRLDFGLGHAIHGLAADPWCHRAFVGVDPPIGQQEQLLVEQLSVESLNRQATPAAFPDDAQHRFGITHLAHLPSLNLSITCAASPM
jgi:hypothetical protein